jgi:hypothetical protein
MKGSEFTLIVPPFQSSSIPFFSILSPYFHRKWQGANLQLNNPMNPSNLSRLPCNEYVRGEMRVPRGM